MEDSISFLTDQQLSNLFKQAGHAKFVNKVITELNFVKNSDINKGIKSIYEKLN